MGRTVDWYLAITLFVVGLSHLLRPGDWSEVYRQLHACGHMGAFINDGLSLGHRRGRRRWAGLLGVAGGGASRFGVAAGRQGAGLPHSAPSGAPLDGTRWPFPALVRRRWSGYAGAERLGVLLSLVRGVDAEPDASADGGNE